MERKRDGSLSLEVKVGITAAVALVFLGMIIMTVEKFHFGQKGYPIIVSFDFVDALNPQADVVIGGGVKIGRVDSITTQGEKINLRILINDSVKLPSDAKFQILSKGMMGDKYVNVIPQTTSQEFLKPGARVEGVEPSNIDKTFQRFGQLADSVRVLIGDPEMKTSIIDLLKNVSKLSKRIDRMAQQNEQNINDSLRDLSAASKDIRQFSRDLKEITQGLKTILATENQENINSTLRNLKTTSERLDKTLVKIEAGQGTLGELIEDKEMAEDLKKLIKDLKNNPWKLLWKK
jgi:phospholipid/cholesterol/gamma-HCH transport system substrate-binding protein